MVTGTAVPSTLDESVFATFGIVTDYSPPIVNILYSRSEQITQYKTLGIEAYFAYNQFVLNIVFVYFIFQSMYIILHQKIKDPIPIRINLHDMWLNINMSWHKTKQLYRM